MSAVPRMRVLVADDDRLLRDIAAAMLEDAAFVVEAVPGGDEAVAACLRQMPDLVLLDVEMPGSDGYQSCLNIRALPGGLDVPIVMVTGLDDQRSINLTYDAGATDFVVKPINWPLLTHRIRYVLRGARTIEALRLAESGDTQELFRFYRDVLLNDDHIAGEFSTRKLAVLSQPLAILPEDKNNPDDVLLAKAMLRAKNDCENWLDGMKTLMGSHAIWPVTIAELDATAPILAEGNGDAAGGDAHVDIGLLLAEIDQPRDQPTHRKGRPDADPVAQ